MSSDYISRQAAIDAADRADYPGLAVEVVKAVTDEVIKELIKLPSADAVEIIRCKDCKHWIPYDWMFSEVWKSQNIDDYAESEIGCTYCDMSMGAMDYCSRGERKDG